MENSCMVEYIVVPAAFLARTRQKYLALFASPLTTLKVSTAVVSFKNTPSTKLESVATCTWYDAAPKATFHRSIKLVGWFEWPFRGRTSIGVGGGRIRVAKLNGLEKALVPPAFFAFARQE